MIDTTTNEFKGKAVAPLNGWTEKEKAYLRRIGMTEDKPTDPVEYERYLVREWRAARRYYDARARNCYRVDPDTLDLETL
jgi:hypothetical protein